MDSEDIMSNWKQDKREQVRLLLSPREAAKALSVCERTLYGLTKAGKLPVIRIGRAVRYSLDDLRVWIENQK